jgi:hypothetical protein
VPLTQILRPLAEGNYVAWVLVAGASKVAAVDTGDPVSHDDLTTHLHTNYSGGPAQKQSFTLTNKPPSEGFVTDVRMGIRISNPDDIAHQTDFFARLSGADGAVLTSASQGAGAGFETFGPTSLPRPGGGAWTMADVQSATFEMCGSNRGEGTNIERPFVTSMWVEVDYNPTVGGFFCVVN